MDVVGEKYSGVFKSLSPRSKNVGDWYFVKEGMLACVENCCWDFFFFSW